MAKRQSWQELEGLIDAQGREWARLRKQAPAAAKLLRLAVKRMAGSPAKRLRWVVDFAQRDLALLQPGELEAVGFDLRGLVYHSLPRHEGFTVKAAPLSEADLQRYQRTLDAGIRGLLSEPPREWIFDVSPRLVVIERDTTSARRSNRRRFAVQLGGKQDASVLTGVANLIVEAGELLRACLECGRPFVAATRQVRYCSSSCSQRARNKRRG
jgi:hypothetical protein